MPSPLRIQFAFPTYYIVDPDGLPKTVEILTSVEPNNPLPASVRLTLIHGWLVQPGTYQFSLAGYRPNGEQMNLDDMPPITRTFTDLLQPLYLSFHNLDIVLDSEGKYEFEAICEGEVAVRYPLFVWTKTRSS